MKTSLGLLEVSGLALAIGAADAMAKAASVTLIGIEQTKGSGWMLIRLTGDVASVQAAISTGAAFAEQHHGLVSHAVLARPADSLMAYWQTPAADITAKAPAEAEAVIEAAEVISAEETEEAEETASADTASDDAPDTAAGSDNVSIDKDSADKNRIDKERTESEAPPAPRVSCNLCLDPACRRHKGEPRFRCIHLGKRGKV
ncbi:BMC domain-containing protein [Yersinia mollaretii]|uniref:Propanediol utilization polyhedral bodies protein n=1 Tax=Yersinia mollaretii TaxID=33060 RepID=A0AA36LNF3_YERMO|nr:BMC domain-containing protein [Yersinia mollaretii]MDA5526608.1 BMC domain-containing protein [Yersinia mollaretii]MDR7873398.1 BMC domain-containing protein [Yersinia mollaretii]PHZ32319.1 BMC domain-containing protein [Yersinia mollaretii]WQC76722.1 BMC domain-containing protein [Yersinia mollaretii]CNE52257.1 putative propanediol utilization polyhedral bodies protein [Yersinia mollaretii]